jgi:hypothetical protein
VPTRTHDGCCGNERRIEVPTETFGAREEHDDATLVRKGALRRIVLGILRDAQTIGQSHLAKPQFESHGKLGLSGYSCPTVVGTRDIACGSEKSHWVEKFSQGRKSWKQHQLWRSTSKPRRQHRARDQSPLPDLGIRCSESLRCWIL